MTSKRGKILWVSPEQMVLLIGSVFPLPDGVELMDCRFDKSRGCIGVKLRHDSFPVVPEGNLYSSVSLSESSGSSAKLSHTGRGGMEMKNDWAAKAAEYIVGRIDMLNSSKHRAEYVALVEACIERFRILGK